MKKLINKSKIFFAKVTIVSLEFLAEFVKFFGDKLLESITKDDDALYK